jgi:hypothetical protein
MKVEKEIDIDQREKEDRDHGRSQDDCHGRED